MYVEAFLVKINKGPLISKICLSEEDTKHVIVSHKKQNLSKNLSYRIIEGMKIKVSEFKKIKYK